MPVGGQGRAGGALAAAGLPGVPRRMAGVMGEQRATRKERMSMPTAPRSLGFRKPAHEAGQLPCQSGWLETVGQ